MREKERGREGEGGGREGERLWRWKVGERERGK